jgi:hypothetical protein
VVEASSGAAKENLVPFGIAAAEPTSDLPDGKVPEVPRCLVLPSLSLLAASR